MPGPEGAPVQQCTGATRQLAGSVIEIHQQISCLLHGPRGVLVRGHAEDMNVTSAHLDHEENVDAARVTAQSTWKKSHASMLAACVRRNCRHVGWPRCVAGGIRSGPGNSRARPAITARPAQSSFGLGFCAAAPTSWRGTSNSGALVPRQAMSALFCST
jgi:hypothetical protein